MDFIIQEVCTRVFEYPAFHLRTGVTTGVLSSLSRFFSFFFQPHRVFPRLYLEKRPRKIASKKPTLNLSPAVPSPRHCNNTRVINPRHYPSDHGLP